MTNARTLTVYQEDLKSIGNEHLGEAGYLSVVCDLETVHIEEIMLREILKCFGDYKITAAVDHVWECGVLNVKLTTNLPFDIARKVLAL